MRISNLHSPAPTPSVEKTKETQSTSVAQQTSGDRHDQATMGNIASAVHNLQTSNSRIAELREQYLNGTYKVDAAKISSKLVDEHIDK